VTPRALATDTLCCLYTLHINGSSRFIHWSSNDPKQSRNSNTTAKITTYLFAVISHCVLCDIRRISETLVLKRFPVLNVTTENTLHMRGSSNFSSGKPTPEQEVYRADKNVRRRIIIQIMTGKSAGNASKPAVTLPFPRQARAVHDSISSTI